MALLFDEITFRYGRRTPVFSGFTLTVSAPATVLLGPNGAGESTLMALAASRLTPTAGTLSFNRLRPGGRKQAAYRKSVAWIPQQITPVPGLTVREQVAYAGWLKGMRRGAAWEASGTAIERVGLGTLANRKSHS
ncbi:ATP-binding cassette domain-containing protein [Streptomyces sp. NPDC051567]|uniref:ATP-binding cassette domain-containing protein n=1 Tax=Streptomyces sp. NPDC051567 TaxID=3365660 RepID=UPI0037ADF7F9